MHLQFTLLAGFRDEAHKSLSISFSGEPAFLTTTLRGVVKRRSDRSPHGRAAETAGKQNQVIEVRQLVALPVRH